MQSPRPAPLVVCLFVGFLLLTSFPSRQAQSLPLTLSPSVVSGGNGTTRQFTAAGGVPPYTWSATVGGFSPRDIGPDGTTALWKAGGVYADEPAYTVLSIVSEVPPGDGSLGFISGGASGPVYDGVQWTMIRYDYYNCNGELYRVFFSGPWRHPNNTQYFFDSMVSSAGNPIVARTPAAQAAG